MGGYFLQEFSKVEINQREDPDCSRFNVTCSNGIGSQEREVEVVALFDCVCTAYSKIMRACAGKVALG